MSDQLTAADLKGLSAEEIVAANKAGQLDTLLGRKPRQTWDGTRQLTAEDVKHLSPEQIVQAQRDGVLDHYLGRTSTNHVPIQY